MSDNKGLFGAIIVLVGTAVFLLFRLWLSPYYPAWYWSVPTFFFLNACLFSYIVSREEKATFSIQKHLLLKMLKTFGALLLLVCYVVFIKTNALSFAIVIAVFYVLYTVLETKSLLHLNKKQTVNETDKK